MQTRGLARQAAKLRDQQLKILIQSNPVGFDGQVSGNNATFFAASGTGHLTDVGNANSVQQFNDFTSKAFTPSNYGSVRASMEGFIAKDGNPYYSEADTVVHPPALKEAVWNVLNGDFIAPALFGGQTQVGANDNKNVWKGTAKPVQIEEFYNQPTVWYLLDTSKVVKPFVVQKRQDFQAVYVTDPQHPSILFNKELLFAMDARFAFDVTMWWLACRATA
jgi:phage major head subunit gpT-like protein